MAGLSEGEIRERLRELPGWRLSDGAIEREWTLADFPSAIAFVGRVAEVAEREDHHPDILIHGWNRVRLTLSTHSQGSVTAADIALAGLLDRLD